MQPSQQHKRQYGWWFFLFAVALILSFYLPVGQKLKLAVAPIVHVVQAPVRWYEGFSLWFEDSADLQKKYALLQTNNARHDVVALELTALRTENRQLRRLLHINESPGYTWQVARVVSRSPEEKSRRLILASSQTYVDNVIVSDQGLVGLVDDSGKKHAVVRTILDASIAVPVTMQGSNLAALVRGDGSHLMVDFVPVKYMPKVGDVLLTSGAGGLFPAGIPVAKVYEVSPIEGGVFAQVKAHPVAHWQRHAWLAIAAQQPIDAL